MASYKLKINIMAQKDLDELYVNGFHNWGEIQADLYYDQFIQRFEELKDQPLIYQTVDYIRVGYRRSVCGVHSIYYRIDCQSVEVMRILGQQNIKTLSEKSGK